MGTVEHVGNTWDLKRRFRQHTKCKKTKLSKTGHGKFYGRQDISMHVISAHPTKSEARSEEMRLQSFWGFVNESQKMKSSMTGKLLGSKNGNSNLTEEQVREIKFFLKQGISCSRIGRQYKVTHTAISLIKMGKTWSHITI